MMIQTIKTLKTSLRAFTFFTLLTGILYPSLVTTVSQIFMPAQANGSLKKIGDSPVGSELIAQKFSGPEYFHSRPSAADFATIPTGASNLSPTSARLKDTIDDRRTNLGTGAPHDLITSSASGLDPHITPAAAMFQIQRIATARSLKSDDIIALENLVVQLTESPQFGFLGMPRVNVLDLNTKLHNRFLETSP